MTDEKKCTKCGEVKPINQFYKSNRNKDGKCNWCKSCISLYYRLYRKSNTSCVICGRSLPAGRHKYCSRCSPMVNTCCDFLKLHHDAYKDDPEHLSADFIKNLMHCKCEVEK